MTGGHEIVGANPTGLICLRSSVVEHFLGKEAVLGASPSVGFEYCQPALPR